MRKLSYKEVEYKFNNASKYQVEYDELFDQVIKQRGRYYCNNNKVTNYHQTKNEIKATVEGTENYEVYILKEKELKAECTCPYYKKNQKLCKHIYAVLLEEQKQKTIKEYKKDINSIIKEMDKVYTKIQSLLDEYQRFFDREAFNKDLEDYYDNPIKKIKEEMNTSKTLDLYRCHLSVQGSYNDLVRCHNHLIDDIKYYLDDEAAVLEAEREEAELDAMVLEEEEDPDFEENMKALKVLENSVVRDASTYDLKTLENLRQQFISTGQDTRLVDRAIALNKKRSARIARHNLWKTIKLILAILALPATIFFFIMKILLNLKSGYESSGSSDSILFPWEKDAKDYMGYEDYNFEEDEMEEDDYYYEDD